MVEILVEIKATELVVNVEGRVVGVKAEDKDEIELELKTNKGVVLDTGGFYANVELKANTNPKLDSTIPITNHLGATGDGIDMVDKIGADIMRLGRKVVA